MANYWDILIDDDQVTKEDLFLRIRDQYTAYLRHLYDNPKDIPDYQIHFASEQRSIEEGSELGYPVATVDRRSNQVEETIVQDVTQIANFENSYTWYRENIFVIFDFKEEGITPLTFITRAFFEELFNQILSYGIRKLKISHMYELLITSGVNEFFYGFYRLDINFLQNLSSATYESMYADSRILVPRYESKAVRRKHRGDLDVMFSDPIPFTIENLRQVRKLLEMANEGLALVVSETGRIRGLTYSPAQENECDIRILGHMTWSIAYEGNKRITYRGGKYHIRKPRELTAIDLETVLIGIARDITQTDIHRVEQVILEASKQKHGTIIIIGKEADIRSETERLCEAKNAIGVARVNLDKAPGVIPSLTSIDGALFMDTSCICWSIGAILDGDAVAKGSMARGARFNSTVNYVKRRSQLDQEFIGIVRSEDGTVDIVTSDRVERVHQE